MSNTLKKSLKRKKKLKSSRNTKHKQEHENLLVVTPELIELGQALSGLSVAPLSTLLRPVRGLYRDKFGGLVRVISVSERAQNGDFTVTYCDVDSTSGLDCSEPEVKNAYDWTQFDLLFDLYLLDMLHEDCDFD